MSDAELPEDERERLMDALGLEMHFAKSREERMDAWERLRALTKLRSAERIAKMEQEKGLT